MLDSNLLYVFLMEVSNEEKNDCSHEKDFHCFFYMCLEKEFQMSLDERMNECVPSNSRGKMFLICDL